MEEEVIFEDCIDFNKLYHKTINYLDDFLDKYEEIYKTKPRYIYIPNYVYYAISFYYPKMVNIFGVADYRKTEEIKTYRGIPIKPDRIGDTIYLPEPFTEYEKRIYLNKLKVQKCIFFY